MPVVQPNAPQPAPPSSPSDAPINTQGASGSLAIRLDRLETRMDFLHNYTAFPLVLNLQNVTATTAPFVVGAVTIPWGLIRPQLQIPEDRWDVWLSGILANTGGTTTVGLYYWKNDNSTVRLGSQTIASGPVAKVAIGPFPARGVFAAQAGAPQNEQVPGFALSVTVSAGTANIWYWTMWMRQSPRRS